MSIEVSEWAEPISHHKVADCLYPMAQSNKSIISSIEMPNRIHRPVGKSITFDGHATFQTQHLLKNSHLQTIWGVYFRKIPKIETRQAMFTLSDGDHIKLSYCHTGSNDWVIILHGLTGCSDANYILGIQKALAQQGLSSVTINSRGADGEPNKHARAFHAGHTADFLEVLRYLQSQPDVKTISALGYSLGANILLKALGESANIGLEAAIAISPPFNLEACANHVDKGINRLYRNYLLNRLKKRFIKKREHFQSLSPEDQSLHSGWHKVGRELHDIGCIKSIRSFWSYDNFVVAPLEGFRNVHHYYESSSSKNYLKSIKTPTLIICAQDDPIVPKTSIPTQTELSKHTHLEVYRQGGHQGFLQLQNNRIDYWLDKRVPHFFNTILHPDDGICKQ